ncbi:phage tail assembly protein [Neisseria weaveri]|uniref:Phage protein n=1 Tax=Neisseria weaveri TaxID=28091 RepID=A0A448VJP2_9NEIS|nr:phage tail assembly protein [Neisseria weaveri]EGV38451.1 hypothetical protein l11_04740 [Neisseria weaveri LMG 5135]VEJ49996.1 phage protein [Neisseria weaveri]
MNEAKQMQEQLGVSKEIKLKYPVRLATGEMLEKLTLRRPKVGDIRAVAGLATDAEQELAIMARISGLVPEDLDELDLADYKQVQDWFRRSQEGKSESASAE